MTRAAATRNRRGTIPRLTEINSSLPPQPANVPVAPRLQTPCCWGPDGRASGRSRLLAASQGDPDGGDAGGSVAYNPALIDFARHYGFHPAVHTVANTKGKSRSATFDPKAPKPQYASHGPALKAVPDE